MIDYIDCTLNNSLNQGGAMKYIVQYSIPKGKIAITEWTEYTTTIEANSLKDAVSGFSRTHQHLGTWHILDCYPA